MSAAPSRPAETARQLLVDLKVSFARQDSVLPPWADRQVAGIVDEAHETYDKLATVAATAADAASSLAAGAFGPAAAAECYWQHMTYNKRALSAYIAARRNALARHVWADAPVQASTANTQPNATPAERQWLASYKAAVEELADSLGGPPDGSTISSSEGVGVVELMRHRHPPATEMATVRVIRGEGLVMTEDGAVALHTGALLHVRASTAEALIRMGYCA
eukprot:TRINITY_DN8445_c0_g2_i1.p1 TRINITY_DN8445_c0_g2~~TRINITY_DN8445_c0_g2_i1.p1  ORF type:complete len:221 (+),score=16.41 TRINITY_DN8445_c0_g2_i1:180-842(+)